MSRFILTLFASASAFSLAIANQPEADSARKARVALALAGGCGTCRVDLDECRADALRTGKPLVLFIGGCDGRAKELDTSAIYCRVAEYKIESKPVEGVVVLGKLKGEKDALFILAQLPKASTSAEIREAVKVAVGKAPPVKVAVPLDWDFGGSDREPESAADDEPEPTESDAVPIGFQLLQDCPGGRCAVPASTSAGPSSATPRYATAASTQPTAPARRRIFEAKPVRSFLGRLFGRYSCR